MLAQNETICDWLAGDFWFSDSPALLSGGVVLLGWRAGAANGSAGRPSRQRYLQHPDVSAWTGPRRNASSQYASVADEAHCSVGGDGLESFVQQALFSRQQKEALD